MGTELNITEDGKVILEEAPYTGVRRVIGNNFLEAVQDAATASSFIHVDVSKLIALREKYKSEGHKFSFTELYVKLAACAIEKSPFVNAARVGKRIQLYQSKNIAVAIGTPNDLLYAPVIHDVETKGLLEISGELNALIEKANQGMLALEDMQGATFTISNLGNSEVCYTSQILPKPQSCIMGVGRMKKEAVVDENDQIAVRPMAYISITVDHTVVMGSAAKAFYGGIVECLANPEAYLTL